MNTFVQTREFSAWLGGLKSVRALAVIYNRLDRATKGNFGDARALGGGISEMRIDVGPGYRIYYTTSPPSLTTSDVPELCSGPFPRSNR